MNGEILNNTELSQEFEEVKQKLKANGISWTRLLLEAYTRKEGIDLKKMNRINQRVHNIRNKKVKPNYQELLILKNKISEET